MKNNFIVQSLFYQENKTLKYMIYNNHRDSEQNIYFSVLGKVSPEKYISHKRKL